MHQQQTWLVHGYYTVTLQRGTESESTSFAGSMPNNFWFAVVNLVRRASDQMFPSDPRIGIDHNSRSCNLMVPRVPLGALEMTSARSLPEPPIARLPFRQHDRSNYHELAPPGNAQPCGPSFSVSVNLPPKAGQHQLRCKTKAIPIPPSF